MNDNWQAKGRGDGRELRPGKGQASLNCKQLQGPESSSGRLRGAPPPQPGGGGGYCQPATPRSLVDPILDPDQDIFNDVGATSCPKQAKRDLSLQGWVGS